MKDDTRYIESKCPVCGNDMYIEKDGFELFFNGKARIIDNGIYARCDVCPSVIELGTLEMFWEASPEKRKAIHDDCLAQMVDGFEKGFNRANEGGWHVPETN